MHNYYLETLLKRHEARKLFLPCMGFSVPSKPSDLMVQHSEAAWDIARHLAAKREGQRRRTLEKIDRAVAADQLPLRDLWRYAVAHPISGRAPRVSYIIYNATMATTAAPVKQPTGAAIRTMMQLKAATNWFGSIIEWGCSFDGSSAATPGQVELVETAQVGATSLSTAYAAADIQPFEDPNSPVNTAGTGGIPFNLGTSASGFATAAVTEGSTVATRMADFQLLPPTGPYIKQFPLGREFGFGYYALGAAGAQNYLRLRVTFGTTVNMSGYVIVEF